MYFVEKTKGTNFIKQFDYPLFIAVFVLSLIGIAVLKSAIGEAGVSKEWLKQVICLAIGIIIAFVTCAIDYKDFKTLGIILYVGSVILLVLVLIIGEKVNGSRSWLPAPVIGAFQPSEIAKVAFVLVLPVFLERLKDGQHIAKNVIKLLIYMVIPIFLILLQTDAGTALVFVFAFFVMLFVYGIRYRYIFLTIGAVVASAPLLWLFVMPYHMKQRILTFLMPNTELQGSGMQVYRAKMTIGSGQLYGKGLFHGLQAQNGGSMASGYYVPEKQNDFIFSVIGEELGFIGSMLVLLLVFFILFRCLYIARNSRDEYGKFAVIGITAMLAFHFIENIGMNIGVLPVTGIPLPFVSQGGTALITNYVSLGVLLSVSMRRKRTIFNSSQ